MQYSAENRRQTWDVLLGVEQVVIESFFFPMNSLFLVGLRIREALCGPTLSSKKSTEIRSLYQIPVSDLTVLRSSLEACIKDREFTCLWPPPGSGT